jgi:hypothetical protein
VLDDYSFLREIDETTLDDEEFVFFGIRKTRLYVLGRTLGSLKGSQGDGFFTAPNPPSGAVLTYYLKNSLKTLKQERREKEEKIKKKGGDNPYPGWEALEQERREESPSITFVIKDSKGNLVNRITGPTSAGFHRVSWNLRYAPLASTSGSGPLVTPGKYVVTAEKCIRDEITPLGDPQSVEVVPILRPSLPVQNRNTMLEFYMTAGELQRAIRGANGKVNEVLDQMNKIKQAIRQSSKGGPELLEQTRELELKLLDIRETLGGGSVISRYDEPDSISIMNRISTAMSSTGSTYGPTKTNRQDYEIAKEEFEAVYSRAKRLIETDFGKLQKDLETAGIPWTSGRPIPKLEE